MRYAQVNTQLADTVREAVAEQFPVEGRRRRLEVDDVEVVLPDDEHLQDFPAQKRLKLQGKSLTAPVRARVRVVDIKTGKQLAAKKITVARLPVMTPRYSFLVDGKEYQLTNQFLLKPGVYNRVRQDGSLAGEFHLQGKAFDIRFDPETKIFRVKVGGSNPELYPILKALGVDDRQLEKAWGREILGVNQKISARRQEKAPVSFYKAWTGKATTPRDAPEQILERMAGSELDPDVTKVTMGREYTHVSPEVLVDASQQLLGISRGERKPDNRESLVFKRFRSVDQVVGDRLAEHARKLGWKIRRNLDRVDDPAKILPPGSLDAPIQGLFKNSQLSNYNDQTNPMDMLIGALRTTPTGEGGIQSAHALVDELKLIDPSHLGFLDPLNTPEDSKTGVTLTLAEGTVPVKSRGGQLGSILYNVKTGRRELVTPRALIGKTVVPPDQIEWKQGRPKALASKVVTHDPITGEQRRMKLEDADFVITDPVQIYSPTTNLIPFLDSNNPVRAGTGTRQITQAVSLKHREAPLVQVGTTTTDTTSEKHFGQMFTTQSPVDGRVVKITRDYIHIKPHGSRKTIKLGLYRHFPLNNGKGMINSELKVAEGDEVRQGQLIADTNYTRDGVLALGKNLRVAYLPFRGLTFEDGVVVSETGAKKLTSVHLHRKSTDVGKEGRLDKRAYQAYFGNLLPKENADKLDDHGVIKPGARIKKGDILIAGLRKARPGTEAQMLRRLHKSLVKPYTNAALTWDKDVPGVVTDVVKRGNSVQVLVRANHPVVVGDKLTGRHGNKGVVTAVIPDEEMPATKDGPVDVLMNPMTVPGRINLGQVLETAASKVAEKTGRPWVVKNFDPKKGSNLETVADALKKYGLEDKEELVDPQTGKSLGKVLVGRQYIFKLKHMVDTKASARAGGTGYGYDQDNIPKGGGPTGAKSIGNLGVYALLAHGLRRNLQEMHTWKVDMDQADQLWTAIQSGSPPPAPRATFAYQKFVNLLRAAGVDTKKQGNSLVLTPMTDADIIKLGPGEIRDPGKMVLAKDPTRGEPGGLFDPQVTGGVDGRRWAHIKLPEPVPNPLFETGIRSLLGLTKDKYEKIVGGELGVDAQGQLVDADHAKYVGGPAVKHLLDRVDVDRELREQKKLLPHLRRDELDKAHRRYKYLQNLKKLGLKPSEAYMNQVLPVLPPKFRPLTVDQDGNIVRDDLNELYKGVGLISSQLKQLKTAKLPESELKDLRKDLYDALRAYTGVGTHPQLQYKGVLNIIEGKTPRGSRAEGSPKHGFFQRKLVGARQDMSLYSTINPNPQLGLDEVGLPKALAQRVYEPFVVRRLTRSEGVSPLQARQLIRKNDPRAEAALRQEVRERPVLLKRDPALHRYSVQAFKPVLVAGKRIQIHPLVTGGFNADFDGDFQIGSVFALLTKDFFNAGVDNFTKGGSLESWVKERRFKMTARFREVLGYVDGDGVWITCDLADFPRDRLEATRGHIDFWTVPPGVKVVAWDEDANRPVLADVSHWSFHRRRRMEIVTLGSGRQILTDDDPRAVYGIEADTLRWCRRRPAEAGNVLVPVVDRLPETLDGPQELKLPVDDQLRDRVRLGWDFGYLLGVMGGGGWTTGVGDRHRFVNLAVTDPDVRRAWEKSLGSVFRSTPTIATRYANGRRLGKSGEPTVLVVNHTGLSEWVYRRDLVGTSAGEKHLPPFYLQAPVEFRLGLLAGLWDAGGTANVTKKGQLNVSYYSTSLRLVHEIQLLLQYFGVGARITSTKTAAGESGWVLSVSKPDLWDAQVISPKSGRKAQALDAFYSGPQPDKSMAYSRFRLVPVSTSLARDLRKIITHKRDPSIYATLSKAVDRHYMSKELARRVVEIVGGRCHNPVYEQWVALVESDVHFERVQGVEVTDVVEDGYDLTVPGYETFMSLGGHVLSNTMSAYVPVSTEAVQEAWRALPSRNLFSAATGGIMYTPTKEMLVGLFLATDPDHQLKSGKKAAFKTADEAYRAALRGDVRMNQVVAVGGRQTTPARARLEAILPDKLRSKYTGKTWDKKVQKQLFTDLGKLDADRYSEWVNAIKDTANDFMYHTGFSLGLDEYRPVKQVRDRGLRAINAAVQKVRDPQKRLKLIDIGSEKMYQELKKVKEKNPDPLYLLTLSGVKPGPEQYRQIALAPMLMTRPDGTVSPEPVTRSYSEGLRLMDYWAASSGARKGIITKVQSIQEPGALMKQMVNSTLDRVIIDSGCEGQDGISARTDSPQEIVNRYLAKPVRAGKHTYPQDTLITPEVASALRSNGVSKVVVRSPLKCVHGEAGGLCAKCYGLSPDGHLPEPGENVGVEAAQALGERAEQITLKAFHGGGVLPFGGTYKQTGLLDQMGRLKQLLTLPKNMPDAAPLAEKSGRVKSVKKDPAGGWQVDIDGRPHYVPQNMGEPRLVKLGQPADKAPRLKPGMEVKKGDALAPGVVNPHKLLELRGIDSVQRYLTDTLYDIFRPHGIDKRHVEVVVGAMTDTGVVEDPGDVPGFVRGDKVRLSTAKYMNRKSAGAKKMKVRPVLKGVNYAPFDQTEDWQALLNHQRLSQTLVEAAQQGWKSDIQSLNPIPGLAHGATFGRDRVKY